MRHLTKPLILVAILITLLVLASCGGGGEVNADDGGYANFYGKQ